MANIDLKKLSLKERCEHKQWNARLHGYEEVLKIFRGIDDEKSQEWVKYIPVLKKMMVDANANAQEKGMEAALVFLENCGLAGRMVGEMMSSIIQKCIAAPKPKTKDLAVQLALMYIEIDKHEAVIDELIKGMDQTNPKIVAACVNTTTLALHEFGSKVVNVKPIIKKIPQLMSDRDKGIRESAKQLTVEIYRWIGPALKEHIASLPPVAIKELQDEFDHFNGTKAQPIRYLKSEQLRQMQLEDAGGDIGDKADPIDDAASPIETIAPVDLAPQPINLLCHIPKDFYSKLKETKWSLRKEPLEALEKLLKNHPNLESGDYRTLVATLKNIIVREPNVVLVALAGKCLAMLAKSLGKRFSPFTMVCMPSLLQKFKEKKPNVLVVIREAVDAIYPATSLETIHECVIEALNNKSPSVKSETASFLARIFSCTQPIANKKLFQALTTSLVKTLNEPDPIVRDAAAEALGTLSKLMGDRPMAPILENIDAFKLSKIKEFQDKAVIKITIIKPTAGSTASGNTPTQTKSSTRRVTNAAGAKKTAPVTAGSSVVAPKPKKDAANRTK